MISKQDFEELETTREFDLFVDCFMDDEEAFAARLPALWQELGNVIKETKDADSVGHGLIEHLLEAIVRAAEEISGVEWKKRGGDRANFAWMIIKHRTGDPTVRLAIYYLFHKVIGWENEATRLDYKALGFSEQLFRAREWAPEKTIPKERIFENAQRLRSQRKLVSVLEDARTDSQEAGSKAKIFEQTGPSQSPFEPAGPWQIRLQTQKPRVETEDYNFLNVEFAGHNLNTEEHVGAFVQISVRPQSYGTPYVVGYTKARAMFTLSGEELGALRYNPAL